MSEYLHLLISVTVLLGLVSCEPVFDITDPAFIQECVSEHNRHRANVNPEAANMRYMTWDEGLAVTARAWARFCIFKHNIHLKEVRRVHPTFTSVGENIWAGTPYSSFKPESAVMLWNNEDKDYNYDTKQCSKVCGHYTQIVWADSYKVGCAAQACPNGVAETRFSTVPGIIFVCNYATAGNYAGVSPYKRGASCSSCKQETCRAKLCQNSTRDALQSYNWTPDWDPAVDNNWTPDWDPALSSCGSSCVAVVIIRLISVPLMFACVFCLQRRYSLFAYE